MRRAVIFVLVISTISLASRMLRAESALVVLVRPAAQSDVVSEAITRIRGELIADGFEVSVVDSLPGSDSASVLARADQQTGAAATLGLFLHPAANAAELWVIDRLTNKTVVRSVAMTQSPASAVPEVLARRSVELLRASLLEILVDAQKRPLARPAPRAQASRWVARALEPRQSSWGVEAGAQVLAGFGGAIVKAAWLAMLVLGCGPGYIDAVGLAPTTLGTGLVAHWTFDQAEGPTLVDDSDNRRNGNVSGGVFRNDGRFDGALHLRPGDSVTVDNFPYATPSWTFSAWLRISAEDMPPVDFGTVVSTEVMQQGGWEFQTRGHSSGTYWTFAYWVGPGLAYAHYDCHCLELGRWSHATVVVDAAANLLSFYVDGKLAEQFPPPRPILPGSSALYMGKWMGPDRLFSGSIDDVAIYHRALSAAEVAELDVRPPPRP